MVEGAEGLKIVIDRLFLSLLYFECLIYIV
jgi:hypothetical protein